MKRIYQLTKHSEYGNFVRMINSSERHQKQDCSFRDGENEWRMSLLSESARRGRLPLLAPSIPCVTRQTLIASVTPTTSTERKEKGRNHLLPPINITRDLKQMKNRQNLKLWRAL